MEYTRKRFLSKGNSGSKVNLEEYRETQEDLESATNRSQLIPQPQKMKVVLQPTQDP